MRSRKRVASSGRRRSDRQWSTASAKSRCVEMQSDSETSGFVNRPLNRPGIPGDSIS